MSQSRSFIRSLLSHKKVKYAGGALLALLVLGFVGSRLSASSKSEGVVQIGSTSSTKGDQSDGVKRVQLDHSIDIPVGQDDDVITYRITEAELRDTIVLKGQNAHATDGRQFLVLNIKLSNSLEERIKINTRDYVRLNINNSEDFLAPSIHNDPVEVQPISDQYTRVGFSIKKSDSDLKLLVGEISGDKTEVPITFE